MRVLVVEDSRTLADALVEGLQDERMAVDVAYDGLQAATKLDLNTYDVVVLDRDLPGMHGDTICRMITERENPAMVLMLTASGTPAQRVSGLSLGADDYLPKPFHFPELVLRIRALARRRPTAQARIFRAAGIELDPLHHTATRDGRRLDLSAKEFARTRSPDARPTRRPQRRRPLRPGMGRERRPVHQHRPRHHQPTATQARRTSSDRNHHQRRIPHHRIPLTRRRRRTSLPRGCFHLPFDARGARSFQRRTRRCSVFISRATAWA